MKKLYVFLITYSKRFHLTSPFYEKLEMTTKKTRILESFIIVGSFDYDRTQFWKINLKFQLHTIATKVMISLLPKTYFTYYDDYFLSLKKYSCHINIIFYPCGWNIVIYMKNIWLMWLKYSSKILCFSQKFSSLLTSTPLMLTHSHDSCIDRHGVKEQSKGCKNKHA